MKRKTNKPRPEAQTQTEPVNGAAEPEGSAFGLALNRSPGRLALRDKVSQSQNSAKKPARTSGGIKAPHGEARRKTGTGPGKAGKAKAAETKRPDP